ncbi:MAG TPA: YsnF/AvaK domain-containing protein [Acidobacteriaceae bacterium]|nr:YsnF/AvaK domain-containing protein [Acidobacteriaceae bacterium]
MRTIDTAHAGSTDEARETVIPLFEERLAVTRQVMPTARVQVSRVTHSHEELVDELLSREKVEVERVAIDQLVKTMPPVREEGDYLIIPVVEEVLKIERVLVLKEEVRIRRVQHTERYQERVTLRRQQAVVNRLPIDESTALEPKENL